MLSTVSSLIAGQVKPCVRLAEDVNIVWEEGDLEVIPGVGTVQRAWAEAPSIVNTWPLNRLQV